MTLADFARSQRHRVVADEKWGPCLLDAPPASSSSTVRTVIKKQNTGIPGWIELNFQDISDAAWHTGVYALKYSFWRCSSYS